MASWLLLQQCCAQERGHCHREEEEGGGAQANVRCLIDPHCHTNASVLTASCSDQIPSSMFFKYNSDLGPPYNVLVDTNFINFSIKNKLEVVSAMMDCLLAKCIPCITDCVMAELEKLGHKYRVALRLAKDPRFERLPCTHKGTYADDCLLQRVQQHRCYLVATCDRELKRRIRKVPGVPIMYISNRKYVIERLPEANAAKIK